MSKKAERKTELVIFDLFGTLIKFGLMNHPFRHLLIWAKANGRRPTPDDARILMTKNTDIKGLIEVLEITPPEWLVNQIEVQIQQELDSLCLFYDVKPIFSELSKLEIPIAICSNLALPYGMALDSLLHEFKYIRCLSYEVGFIKPDREIYQAVIDSANVSPERCLFVGDTRLADVDGPRQFGMSALHLVRENGVSEKGIINSLVEIVMHV